MRSPTNESADYEPLKSSYTDFDAEYDTSDVGPSQSIKRPLRRILIVLVIVVQVVFDFLVIANAIYDAVHPHLISACPVAQRLYSPAQDALEYQTYKFDSGFGAGTTIYQGEPSDVVDQAWEDLYSFGILEVPRSQAALMVNNTRPIPGKEGYYITELDVFHELHCLNMIRQKLSPEYYGQNMTGLHKSLMRPEHISHCIDTIRQSLMCSSDISTIVWVWEEDTHTAKPSGTVLHSCRNFDKIRDWAKEHHISVHFDDSVYVEDDLSVPVIP